jgi:hypothetical protein
MHPTARRIVAVAAAMTLVHARGTHRGLQAIVEQLPVCFKTNSFLDTSKFEKVAL